jgi:hypothetical protein
MGYNDNAKAYRFYNLSSKTIIISRDVKFHEESQLQNLRERESNNKGQFTSTRITHYTPSTY